MERKGKGREIVKGRLKGKKGWWIRGREK